MAIVARNGKKYKVDSKGRDLMVDLNPGTHKATAKPYTPGTAKKENLPYKPKTTASKTSSGMVRKKTTTNSTMRNGSAGQRTIKKKEY